MNKYRHFIISALFGLRVADESETEIIVVAVEEEVEDAPNGRCSSAAAAGGGGGQRARSLGACASCNFVRAADRAAIRRWASRRSRRRLSHEFGIVAKSGFKQSTIELQSRPVGFCVFWSVLKCYTLY